MMDGNLNGWYSILSLSLFPFYDSPNPMLKSELKLKLYIEREWLQCTIFSCIHHTHSLFMPIDHFLYSKGQDGPHASFDWFMSSRCGFNMHLCYLSSLNLIDKVALMQLLFIICNVMI